MRWQASWMLQNSDLETFAAVHACKRAKQATTQVLRKASSSIKQERSEWSDDRCCDWCHSLPASLSVRQKFEFSNQITMPAHHCKTWLCAPSQLEDGQDSSSPPFFLIHGPIGLGSMMCKVLSRQRVFMKQLLGYRTRVTLRSSPREDDENLNLVNSCVGHAETALVSSPCTFLWDQQHCLLSKWLGGLWSIDLLNLAWFLVFVSKDWHKHNFLQSLIPINLKLIPFIWLHLANDHLKSIWNEIEMINCRKCCENVHPHRR